MCGRVPLMRETDALLIGIVNILCPGAGVLVAAARESFPSDLIVIGVAQFVLSFIIVGWVWAIIWSLQLIAKASSPQSTTERAASAFEPVVAAPFAGPTDAAATQDNGKMPADQPKGHHTAGGGPVLHDLAYGSAPFPSPSAPTAEHAGQYQPSPPPPPPAAGFVP
jgi:hypothetical protein